MAEFNKLKVFGISALFLAASALLVFGGPLGNLAFAAGPVSAVEVSAVDEASRLTPVSTIAINNGTIRMIATTTPIAPDDAAIVWTVVNGTGSATIDRCGQLFAVTNGTVTAVGTSHSNPDIFGTKIITITNQLEKIDIKTGADYTILAQTGISSLGVTVKGNIASNAAAADSITGFGTLSIDTSGEFSKSDQVDGNVYLSTYGSPTPSKLGTASGDVGTAYSTGSLITPTGVSEPYSGDIGGHEFAPGVYKWSTTVTINTSVTLNGNATDIWIFQIAGGITQAESTSIILTGGAKPENVFWLSATTVAIGANCHFSGIVLAQTNVSVGAGSTIDGRIFAQTGVALGATCIVRYPGYVVA